MARKSTKTEVKAMETAIEPKVEDIKTEDKATETKVAEETATGTKKAPAKKAASQKEAKAPKDTGVKTTRGAVKREEAKTSVQIQYAGKAYGLEELEKAAREIWKGELKQKVGDLKSIELYMKPEENKVYYVMNKEFKGSFDI